MGEISRDRTLDARTPRTSVCIPVHNGSRSLQATLDSVLDQTDDDYEVVVVDNASSDGTPDILSRVAHPRVRVHRYERLLPLAENWRRATDLCTGRYLKIVCADDLIDPEAISRQADLLDRRQDISLVVSRRRLVDAGQETLAPVTGLNFLLGQRDGRTVARRAVLLGHNPIGEPGSAMFRRKDYERVGGWDGTFLFPMDIDLWLKLLRHGDMLGMPDVLASFRISPDGRSWARTPEMLWEITEYLATVGTDPRWSVPPALARCSRRLTWLAWVAWDIRQAVWRLKAALPTRRTQDFTS
ncbi:glycosyltransferase family 2 protein [Naumannella halotolerans]|uniref:Glycosyl transferase family 2 n=1 Tax=Naumannella halotolerans TaxID=993414 RepID=A0A4R7J900_9ACTN|nr:glycosyltransferase [Naumannella halotolerans]TDT33037.1 glycosyl transferase family 2 [Naumannella halotolerans]